MLVLQLLDTMQDQSIVHLKFVLYQLLMVLELSDHTFVSSQEPLVLIVHMLQNQPLEAWVSPQESIEPQLQFRVLLESQLPFIHHISVFIRLQS